MSFAPGIGVDVKRVAVLRKTVDHGADAGGFAKDAGPLLVRKVGGDDDGSFFVPATDDVKQHVGGSAVARDVSKLIKDQQVRVDVPLQSALCRRNRLLSNEIDESSGDRCKPVNAYALWVS
jgi:hypothetical protein